MCRQNAIVFLKKQLLAPACNSLVYCCSRGVLPRSISELNVYPLSEVAPGICTAWRSLRMTIVGAGADSVASSPSGTNRAASNFR